MKAFAEEFADRIKGQSKSIIFLHGDLGAGKTTFSQLLLQALGWPGRVKSPTYSLIEPYEIGKRQVFHLDLYRIHQAEELYFMGISDLFDQDALFLIEWPDRLQSLAIKPDYDLFLEIDPEHPSARKLSLRIA